MKSKRRLIKTEIYYSPLLKKKMKLKFYKEGNIISMEYATKMKFMPLDNNQKETGILQFSK